MMRLAVMLCLLLVSCGTAPEPSSPPPSSTTSSAAPSKPSVLFYIYSLTYRVDLSLVCTSRTPYADPECGKSIDNAGQVATKMKEDFPGHAEIVRTADDVLQMVSTMRKLGCYGLGQPAGDVKVLTEMCPTFAQYVHYTWLQFSSTASR